jgi:hypothetical protein
MGSSAWWTKTIPCRPKAEGQREKGEGAEEHHTREEQRSNYLVLMDPEYVRETGLDNEDVVWGDDHRVLRPTCPTSEEN